MPSDTSNSPQPTPRRYGAARIAVSGESAGGNQALGLLHHLRDQGMPLPACAALLSPWCDLANQGDSHDFNDDRDPSLSRPWVDIAAGLHAAGHALDDPGISPLHGDMRGLPPVMITTGSRDLLLSQALRLAQPGRTFVALLTATATVAAAVLSTPWLLAWQLWAGATAVQLLPPMAFLARDGVPGRYLVRYPLVTVFAVLWLPIQVLSRFTRGWYHTPHRGS